MIFSSCRCLDYGILCRPQQHRADLKVSGLQAMRSCRAFCREWDTKGPIWLQLSAFVVWRGCRSQLLTYQNVLHISPSHQRTQIKLMVTLTYRKREKHFTLSARSPNTTSRAPVVSSVTEPSESVRATAFPRYSFRQKTSPWSTMNIAECCQSFSVLLAYPKSAVHPGCSPRFSFFLRSMVLSWCTLPVPKGSFTST